MKNIVLCADDYGQALTISAGILELVKLKRLTAVSCMVNSPTWQAAASQLLPYRHDIDIGLHFNLTEGKPLSAIPSFTSLPTLLRKAYSFNLNQASIALELEAQINEFEKTMGFLPQFLDGHQHIHHFPIIRKALIDVYNQRLKPTHAYIRLVDMRLKPVDFLTKKFVIYMTGVRRFKQLLDVHGIPHNKSFSGIYAFEEARQYPSRCRKFLQEIEEGGIIMCHPGLRDESGEDIIADARFQEYQYLSSDQFQRDCIDQDVVLARFL